MQLTRREMCRLLAAGPSAALLGAARLEADEKQPFALRYALASCMYGTLKLEDILPEVRKIGATEIDLWPKRHGDQREQMDAMGHDRFAQLLAENKVRLGMTTRYDLGPFGLAPELPVLKRFGATLVITGSSGPKDVKGDQCRRAVKEFVEKMKPHVAAAEEHGVVIGIENHGNALIDSPESLRYLAEYAKSPNLGIAMAPYHLPQDPALLARLIEDLGPKLVHFYAWQHVQGCMKQMPKEQELEQMPGRGTLDFRPILAALAKINYSGRTQIFMHPTPRGIPILETIDQVTAEINRARKYLADCLG